jgi:hypothetical protein
MTVRTPGRRLCSDPARWIASYVAIPMARISFKLLLSVRADCSRSLSAESLVCRVFVIFENLWQRLRGSQFRAFVNPPERLHAVLERAGLVRAAHGTAMWMFDCIAEKQVASALNPR